MRAFSIGPPRGYQRGENPARWKGHLANLLPKRSRMRKVEHHAALPFSEMPAFMADLRRRDAVAARALEFAILTTARTGEVIGACWSEIDLEARTWTVPAARMKGGREHRVPLSDPAVAILTSMAAIHSGEFVFPGSRAGKPLSNTALLKMLQRMERTDQTAHGFRSTFRDWGSETTHFPSQVVEMALAHAIESKVEAAYQRGDLFQKQRELMEESAEFAT